MAFADISLRLASRIALGMSLRGIDGTQTVLTHRVSWSMHVVWCQRGKENRNRDQCWFCTVDEWRSNVQDRLFPRKHSQRRIAIPFGITGAKPTSSLDVPKNHQCERFTHREMRG